jgi:energy-coupling factor transport system ATP-binding protein
MFRKLTAIEIAEGALLADVGVVFHLLALYLPIGKSVFEVLAPIVFAIIVLRRGFYTGLMSLVVALFTVGIITGLHGVALMLLEAGAGLYLGLTMRSRTNHFFTIIVGTFSGALAFYLLVILSDVILGIPLLELLKGLQTTIHQGLRLVGVLAASIGLGPLWQHNLLPFFLALSTLVFNYWWISYYLVLLVILLPVVIVVYYITNVFVRLLGYDVRPFPGGWIETLLYKTLCGFLRLLPKRGIGKHWMVTNLRREVRRLGIARQRQTEQASPVILSEAKNLSPGETDQSLGSEILRFAQNDKGKFDTNEPALIDIRHISYNYPKHRGQRGASPPVLALNDVSLRINQGEYVALLGHNGSGKSTLARHCNALLPPDEGNVLVDGLNTREASHRRAIRETVGMIFQNPDNQIIATVVEDDVAWALTVRGLPAPLIHERVEEAMQAVGIAHLRGRAPNTLSGGQRQRLAIAGVLALRPRCIIADEATAQLDPLSRQEIVSLLHALRERFGLTILHVTHLLEEAALAQRIVVMEHGAIVMDDAPEVIFADLQRLRDLKLIIPEQIELADRLRRSGIPISQNALTVEALAEELIP